MCKFKPTSELLIGILKNKADVLALMGNYDKALQELDRAYRITCTIHLQPFVEAKQEAFMVYKAKIEQSDIHAKRCWIYKTKGEMEKAVKEGEIGLTLIEELESSINSEFIRNLSTANQMEIIENRLKK